MVEILKLFGEASGTFWQYPAWARVIFVSTFVMVFVSIALIFLLHPNPQSPSQSQQGAGGFSISEPLAGNYIIAKAFSVQGGGARPDAANSLKIKLVDLATGLDTVSGGRLNVNSDGSWRYEYVIFPSPGSYRLVADAIFGTERFSKEIVVNHHPTEVVNAAHTVIANIPEEVEHGPSALSASSRNASHQAVSTLAATSDLESLDNLADTMYRMGNYYLIEHRYEEAIDVYRRLIDRYPRHVKAVNNLARAYRENGQIEESIKVMYATPDVMRARSSSLLNLANVYYATNHKDEALRILKAIIENDPLYRSTYDLAAQISTELGDKAGAERYYEAAITVSEQSFGTDHPQTREFVDKLQRLRDTQAQ